MSVYIRLRYSVKGRWIVTLENILRHFSAIQKVYLYLLYYKWSREVTNLHEQLRTLVFNRIDLGLDFFTPLWQTVSHMANLQITNRTRTVWTPIQSITLCHLLLNNDAFGYQKEEHSKTHEFAVATGCGLSSFSKCAWFPPQQCGIISRTAPLFLKSTLNSYSSTWI